MEELTMIAEIIRQLGEQGKSAFLLYLLYRSGTVVLHYGTVAVVLVTAIRTARGLIADAMLAKEFQRDLGYHDVLTASERRDIRRVWKKGLVAERHKVEQ